MSFRCQACHEAQPNHATPTTVVLETRMHTHPERPDTNDRGGVGTQIVREVKVCMECEFKLAQNAR